MSYQGTSVILSSAGGTGINNNSNTITVNTNSFTVASSNQANTLTLANNLTTAGDYALTLTTTGATNVTLPTSGTLSTTIAGVNVFCAYSETQQSVANTTVVLINWTNTYISTGSGIAIGGVGSTYQIINNSGATRIWQVSYELPVSMSASSTANTLSGAWLELNDSEAGVRFGQVQNVNPVTGATNVTLSLTGSAIISVANNSYVNLALYQNSGQTLTTVPSNNSYGYAKVYINVLQ